MSQPANTSVSTVARKLIMGATGLMIIGFMLTHLAGNLLFYVGQDALNDYTHFLHSIHGFVLVELGLAGVFVIHIVTAVSLVLDNRRARPVPYEKRVEATTLSSRIMPVTGGIVLLFLIVHIWTIRFGAFDVHPQKLYGLVVDLLRQPAYALLYVAGVVFLGPHLRHGLQSSLRSLGLTSKPALEKADLISIGLAIVLTLGFASIPLWILVTKG